MNLLQVFFTGATLLGAITDAQNQKLLVKIYNSSTEVNVGIFPLGTTIVLECTASGLPPQAQYQWTCPHGPCDNEYRKVYNNFIVIVVINTTTTTTSRDRYRCNLNYGDGATYSAGGVARLSSQTLGKGILAVYNDRKRLLRNTLITDPQQIPNGLKCVTGSSGRYGRFRFEDGTTINGTRQGQSTTIQSFQLNQNGLYQCTDSGGVWPFYIYFNNATLPTLHVSLRNTSDEQQLQLQLTTSKGCNNGRFILRYNCKFRGIDPIEVEYKSVSASSDRIVTRDRSCFVKGQISTVTVWFIDGRNISSEPAVVNATSGEVIIKSLCPSPSLPPNTTVLTTLTTTVQPRATITIGCVDGYYTDREEILTCGSDGQWRGNITQCGGTPSCNSPSTNTIVIIAPIAVSMVILLVGITLLVIGVMLIVKRKRHPPTVQYDQESKVRIYDEVGDPVKTSKDTNVYQELDVKKMDDTKQYATPTVQYDQESKVKIDDEVGDPVKTSKDTNVYQELDVKKMDKTKQYATMK